MQQYLGSRPDEGLVVEFYLGSLMDDAATEESRKAGGPPVFRDVPFVRIQVPGNKDEMIEDRAWLDESNPNSHLNRFPGAWARFKAKEATGGTGLPLREWAGILRSQVDVCAYYNIKTVEQLADVSDANIQQVMGGLELRTKAKAFLAQRTSGESMRAELEALKAQLAAMTGPAKAEAVVTVIPAAAVEQVLGPRPADSATQSTSPPVRRRGRPPGAKTTQP